MLGKTALKLKRTETARYWLKCATSYPVRTDEDEAVSSFKYFRNPTKIGIQLEFHFSCFFNSFAFIFM